MQEIKLLNVQGNNLNNWQHWPNKECWSIHGTDDGRRVIRCGPDKTPQGWATLNINNHRFTDPHRPGDCYNYRVKVGVCYPTLDSGHPVRMTHGQQNPNSSLLFNCRNPQGAFQGKMPESVEVQTAYGLAGGLIQTNNGSRSFSGRHKVVDKHPDTPDWAWRGGYTWDENGVEGYFSTDDRMVAELHSKHYTGHRPRRWQDTNPLQGENGLGEWNEYEYEFLDSGQISVWVNRELVCRATDAKPQGLRCLALHCERTVVWFDDPTLYLLDEEPTDPPQEPETIRRPLNPDGTIEPMEGYTAFCVESEVIYQRDEA